LRKAFNFGPITVALWCVAVVAALGGVAWFEIYKTISARRQGLPIKPAPRTLDTWPHHRGDC